MAGPQLAYYQNFWHHEVGDGSALGEELGIVHPPLGITMSYHVMF